MHICDICLLQDLEEKWRDGHFQTRLFDVISRQSPCWWCFLMKDEMGVGHR